MINLLLPTLIAFAPAPKVDPKDPLELALPEGHVAYSLKIDPADQQNGFFAPGTRVNLLVVEKLRGGKVRSTQVAKELLIAAVDVVNDEETKLPKKMTLTLAVKPGDAKILDEAQKKGSLKPVLARPEE